MTTIAVREFDNNEKGYAEWLRVHPRGFVINTRRNRPTAYRVLHRATCRTIDPNTSEKAGASTERQYIKIAAADRESLEREVGPLSSVCSFCSALKG